MFKTQTVSLRNFLLSLFLDLICRHSVSGCTDRLWKKKGDEMHRSLGQMEYVLACKPTELQ